MNTLLAIPALATVSMTMRGTHARVLGRSTGDGGAELIIDGVSAGVVGALPADGALGQVDDLADGWHKVELVGIGDGTVELDAVEAWGDATLPMPAPDTGDTADDTQGESHADSTALPDRHRCSCGAGRASGAWVFLAVGLSAERRRRRAQRAGGTRGVPRRR